MTRQTKILVFIAVILAAAIAGAVLIKGRTYLAYRQQLKNARPDLLFNLTAADPLFYSPNLDAGKLRKSVDNLSKNEREFKETALKKYLFLLKNEELDTKLYEGKFIDYLTYYENYDGLIEDPERTFLFPTSFLKQLPEILEDTDNFLKTKDAESGAKLLEDYEAAVKNYRQSAEEQLEDLRKMIARASGAARLQNASVAANVGILLNNFRLIERNAEALQNEIEKRKNCFYQGLCPPVSKPAADEVRLPAQEAAPMPEETLIPDNLLGERDVESEKLGPYRIRTACYGQGEHLVYILLQRPGGRPSPIFTPKLATENFYWPIGQEPYGKKLLEKGIAFQFQPDGTARICTNLTYWTDLSLMAGGDKLAYLPEMLNAISDIVYLSKAELLFKKPPELYSLSAYRSDYSLLYFPFTERIWRISDKLSYLEGLETLSSTDLKKYSDLKKRFSDGEIKNFHLRDAELRKLIALELEEERDPGFFEWFSAKILYNLPFKLIRSLPVKLSEPFVNQL